MRVSYSEEVADKIVHGLTEGKSMREVCAVEGMPDRVTVVRWMASNEAFASNIARARELQADYMDDLILETANACNSETAQADRVRIWAYQWRASKLRPKVYGDKVTQELTGANGGPIQTQSTVTVYMPENERDVSAG